MPREIRPSACFFKAWLTSYVRANPALGTRGFGAAPLASLQLLHVSSGRAEQSSHSGPEGLRSRNSGHESCRLTPGSVVRLLICSVSPPSPRKFGPSNAEIERNFGAFRNYPLHSDAMNREMIGSGSGRGNGWVREKKSGESAQLYPPNNFIWIASSLHDKRFAPEIREPVAALCRLCFALIGAVKFYDINSQQYKVYHTYRAALRSSSISCTH